jgi:toxin CptA
VQFPIIIGLRRSRFLDGALFVLVFGALLAIGVVPWPLQVAVPLGLGLILFALFVARAWVPPVETLRIDGEGKISGKLAGQSVFIPLRLLTGATAHPWLTVLRLAGEPGSYRLVIVPDSVAPEDFRRLRVCLRWRAEVSDADGDS